MSDAPTSASRSERAELVSRLRMWAIRNHKEQFGTVLGQKQSGPTVEDSDYWKAAACIEALELELAETVSERGPRQTQQTALCDLIDAYNKLPTISKESAGGYACFDTRGRMFFDAALAVVKEAIEPRPVERSD